jgi:hypothetical protein
MKIHLHTEEIDRIKALMESLDYKGDFELEVDSLGTTVTAHVPQSISCLKGTFSYVVSSVENW